jgi:hypothetical protein
MVLVIQNYFSAGLEQAHAASAAARSGTFDTLNVHRINVNDANGTTRLVIANQKKFPGAKVRGKMYKRSIHGSAGIVFYNENGGETGGLAIAQIHGRSQVAQILDYAYQPTDGISMGRSESLDGKRWDASFEIHDRRPYHPGKIKSSQGVKCISLSDQNHDSELVIYDTKGRPRVRIGVGKNGEPHIQMLNAHGQVRYHASQGKQGPNK